MRQNSFISVTKEGADQNERLTLVTTGLLSLFFHRLTELALVGFLRPSDADTHTCFLGRSLLYQRKSKTERPRILKKEKEIDTFLAVLAQQKVCNVLLHTDPPNTPSPFRTEFYVVGCRPLKA